MNANTENPRAIAQVRLGCTGIRSLSVAEKTGRPGALALSSNGQPEPGQKRELLRSEFGRLGFGLLRLAGQFEHLPERVVAGGGAGFGESVEQVGKVHALDLVHGRAERGEVRRERWCAGREES